MSLVVGNFSLNFGKILALHGSPEMIIVSSEYLVGGKSSSCSSWDGSIVTCAHGDCSIHSTPRVASVVGSKAYNIEGGKQSRQEFVNGVDKDQFGSTSHNF